MEQIAGCESPSSGGLCLVEMGGSKVVSVVLTTAQLENLLTVI